MKFGFIGCGNMGRAILGGIIGSNIIPPENILVSDIALDNISDLKEKYKIAITDDNTEAAQADILFLCVKPNVLFPVIEQIKNKICENTVVVSIAAGKSICDIEKAFGANIALVRVMPNTPALVSEGMSALCLNKVMLMPEYSSSVSLITDIFNSFGKCEIVSESVMDAVTAVSGSSPAYVFMFIEAMADAAVKAGMARNIAYKFAAQAVLGSAKMVLETGMHPAQLKDMVCSPAGTTIEAVEVLEKGGFRGIIMDAVKACAEKSANM